MHVTNAARRTSVALLAALLLRAAIPDGYMPATIGSGLFVELCPAGMPAGLIEAVSGSATHDHPAEHTDGGHFDAERCPIGHLLSAAVVVDTGWIDSELPTSSYQDPARPGLAPATRAPVHRSRGPPA